jgi:hypothetical protein
MAKGRSLLGAAGIGLAKIADELDKVDASDATDFTRSIDAPVNEPFPAPPEVPPGTSDSQAISLAGPGATMTMERDQASPLLPPIPIISGTFPLRDKPKKAHSRNASPRIMAGEVKSKSVYVTPEDVDIATDVEGFLKKARVLRGQIGFTMAVRIGLRLLKKKVREDPHVVLELARDLSEK